MSESDRESGQEALGAGNGDLSRRRFLQIGAAGALAVSAGGILAACGSSDDSTSAAGTTGGGGGGGQDVTFGFSHPFAEVPVVVAVKSIVERLAEEEGWKVLLDETEGGKLEDQLATLDTWISQDVTAMCVFPPEPAAFEQTAQRAVDAGIIWTTYAVPMNTGAGGALLPNTLSGRVTGQATVDWINQNNPEAQVLILEFTSPGDPRKRTDVPIAMIEKETSAEIVAVQPAVDQATGFEVTESVLQAHPDVTVVVGINDDGALGAVEAFRKAGTQDPKDVWIIGQDGSEDGLKALKDPNSYYRASAALPIEKLCQNTIAVTKNAIDRGWKPGDQQEDIPLGPTLIENGDIALIDQFLKVY